MKKIVVPFLIFALIAALPCTAWAGGFSATYGKMSTKILQESSEGYILSKNPDYSTFDRDYLLNDTLYVKAWSDRVDYNSVKAAYCELSLGDYLHKFDLTNHLYGTYTGSYELMQLEGGGSWDVHIYIKSQYRGKPVVYEAFDVITVSGEAPPDTNPPTVSIVDPTEGQTISDEKYRILVSATDAEGTIETVEISIDSGTGIDITANFDGTYYYYDWITAEGTHTIDASATDDSGNTGYAAQVTVTVDYAAIVIEYELFIEIDYMAGHEPNQTVLTYIEGYYLDRGINVTFYIDEQISYKATYDDGINDDEFWAIEAEYNDLGDDKVVDGKLIYYSKWKWVLYGNTVEGEPNVVGYCYVVINVATKDLLAGNYIFLADKSADTWAINNGIEVYGAEAVVLMHELGHSVGIGILRGLKELYCADTYCVMSYLNKDNAGLYGNWYYCDDHWATRNMEYYAVAA